MVVLLVQVIADILNILIEPAQPLGLLAAADLLGQGGEGFHPAPFAALINTCVMAFEAVFFQQRLAVFDIRLAAGWDARRPSAASKGRVCFIISASG